MSKVKELAKTRKFWWIIGIVVAISIVFGIGNSSARVELDDGKVNLDKLNAKISETEDKLSELEIKLADTEKMIQEEEDKLTDKQSEVAEVMALVDDRDSLSDELGSKQSELDSINSQIDTKQKELDTLKGKVVEAKGKPIELASGQYFVGADIPEGRYQASGSSNFVVRDSGGSLVVNTILGDGRVGDGDYVFFAVDGYYIETSSKVTLTPVE